MQKRIKDSGLSQSQSRWSKPDGEFVARARITIKSEELQTRRDGLADADEVDNALRMQAREFGDKIDSLRWVIFPQIVRCA